MKLNWLVDNKGDCLGKILRLPLLAVMSVFEINDK